MMDILVIGDIMLDQYITGDCTRISPEAPVPIVDVKKRYQTLGGAANVATNLSSLGMKVGLIGRIGADEYGKLLSTKIVENNILDLCITNKTTTTVKTRIISGNQQIVRLDQEKYQELTDEEIKSVEESIKNYNGKYLLISDYGKGVVNDALMKSIRQIATQKGIKTIIDPKGKSWTKYQDSYLVKPNLKELWEVANIDDIESNQTVEYTAASIRAKFNIQNLLTTRAANGMTLTNKDQSLHFETKKVDVFDVSGAGDTSLAVIAYYLNLGGTLEKAIEASNIASSYVITKKGTYAITKAEFDVLMGDHF
jgi:D-beta-D-heptose 7-phosphate kinase/D-beta-D-heptose 1-phosphate adenosyltransferase